MSKSMLDLIADNLRGKYFQHKDVSSNIIYVPEETILDLERSFYMDGGFFFNSPLDNKNYKIFLHELNEYIEISKEKLNKLQILQKNNQELLPYWTSKTREEIINSKWEELNYEEGILQRHLEKNPKMTLKEATDSLNILP